MAIVAVAILISFHLKHQPTELERKVALPFGIIFWLLALACLLSGLNNYIKTVNRYSRRQALVQTGWGTQLVDTGCLQQLRCYRRDTLKMGSLSIHCNFGCPAQSC